MKILLDINEEYIRGDGQSAIPAEIGHICKFTSDHDNLKNALWALICPTCQGAGELGFLPITCPVCQGTGWRNGQSPEAERTEEE